MGPGLHLWLRLGLGTGTDSQGIPDIELGLNPVLAFGPIRFSIFYWLPLIESIYMLSLS